MITESGVVFPAQKQAVQSDAKSAENTGKTKKTSEKTPVQTPDETADGASATASENPQLTRYLAQEYGGDWAQTVTPKQLQKAKYQLGLAVTDDPALNTPLYNNLTPDAVQELKREYGRRWWDKATEEDVLIVQQASLAGKAQLIGDAAQGNLDAGEESAKTDKIQRQTERAFAAAIRTGELTPLADFDLYEGISEEMDERLVGIVTSNGITIKSKSKHSIARIIGSVEQRRSGVSISDVLDALTNKDAEILPIKAFKNGRSLKFRNKAVEVSINPDTGNIIQVNPVNTRKKVKS